MNTAHTILEQLGGNRFMAMTGARGFVGGDDSLSFSLDRGRKVRVTLDASDTYTVELFKLGRGGLDVRTLGERSGVYADSLRTVFTSLTGLETSL